MVELLAAAGKSSVLDAVELGPNASADTRMGQRLDACGMVKIELH